MNNKKGYSLIELIVVIAIMGVMLGAVGVSVSTLGGQRVKTASRRVYNTLGTAQTVAMSKGNTVFAIVDEDGKTKVYVLYASDGSTYYEAESSEISSSVVVSFKAGSTTYAVGTAVEEGTTSSKGVVIEIDRSTGKFTGTYEYSGTLSSPIDQALKLDNCTDIYIGTGEKQKDIALVSLTGKFYYRD